MIPLLPATAVAVAALLLGACGSGAPAALEDYLQRIARPLDRQTQTPPLPSLPALPRWESLQLPLESGSLNGLDFLRLRDCALQQTVARRNSSLGRLAPPSQRLLLDLEFLQHAPPCIELLEKRERDELADLLREAQELKRRQLPMAIFNATLGNLEYRDFWRPSPPDEGYPGNTSSIVAEDLRAITDATRRWLAGDYATRDQDFELHLGGVAGGDGGELLLALGQQASYLDAASALLDARADAGPLCRGGLQPRAAHILRNVARQFFVTGVQGRAAALERRRLTLLPLIQDLEEQLAAALPEDYRRWRSERDALLEYWSAAPRRHVRGLQGLLGDCFDEFAPAATADGDASPTPAVASAAPSGKSG